MIPWPKALGGPSFWHSQSPSGQRPPLDGDHSADICIIGAGFTGLWAAFYLMRAAPNLTIIVAEAEHAGFGASGRNGGWLTGGFAWDHRSYLATGSEAGVRAMVRAMSGTVEEVIGIAEAAGIDADIRRTDELLVATNAAQHNRLIAECANRRYWGEDHVHLIDADALARRVHIPGALGAMVVPGVARIQPAKLVHGLAHLVETQGVRIVENTRVTSIRPGHVITTQGIISARTILRATEGFTSQFAHHARDLLPLNSAQIVTAPLPESVWNKIGWQGYEILGDFANAYCYCQRTDDGRIVVGGRGIPYRFGNRLDDQGRPDDKTIRRLIAILHRHFPATIGQTIDHAWCGVLGVPRDWCATIGFDPHTRIGFAGGYVGVGVSTANLAGRTLADLALNRQTALTALPWVNRPLRKWEPEPLRWLALRGMYLLLNAADRAENAGTNPSRLTRLGNWIKNR
ncbi:FAD-binding oxidoreductase [Pseudorhodobacter sp.]|uniref:NAD(P)/FAD-dependent oxidoreductase n=1 Tax=Pseudorhodobacter sp. TaxID=1934400 RepID=UPI0026479CDD|nr:FAD-dependent oxidoreductase [Pseudorhodobacter sp.]MDN5787142.1 FAD-binding oxidoreductase [Pseudorhodobacter sp.]